MNVCVLCMLCSKEQRQSQDNQNEETSITEKKKTTGGGGGSFAPVLTGPGAHWPPKQWILSRFPGVKAAGAWR